MKKYELTKDTTLFEGVLLHRIIALKDIPRYNVKKGDLGGWLESTRNLSHLGDAWVAGDATVLNDARVYGDALASGDAIIMHRAIISDKALVTGSAIVSGYAIVREDAKVYNRAKIKVRAQIFGEAEIGGSTEVAGRAKVFDRVKIHGHAQINEDAVIQNHSDYFVFKNGWYMNTFTWTRSNNKWCLREFYGTGNELLEHVSNCAEEGYKEYERAVLQVDLMLKQSTSSENEG